VLLLGLGVERPRRGKGEFDSLTVLTLPQLDDHTQPAHLQCLPQSRLDWHDSRPGPHGPGPGLTPHTLGQFLGDSIPL
jgi:hypothetical protein